MNTTSEHIYDFVLDCILEGRVTENELLPKEVDLAARFGVSRMTAHKAMKELERHGIVRRKRRVGTVVHRVPSRSLAMHLKGLSARRVHIVAGMEPVPLHWSVATLDELDDLLGREGFRVSHLPIPDPLSRQSLERLIRRIAEEGSSSLVLILPGGASQFFQVHADLVLQYHRDVYLFDRGDTPPEGWPFNVVSLDPFSEGVVAGEYLYRQGYRRIAFLGQASPSYWKGQRSAGLSLGLSRASNGSCRPQVFAMSPEQSLSPVLAWLAGHHGDAAVVAATDEYASILIGQAKERDMLPARDFGVIGFDNNPRYRTFNITTVAPPVARVAQMLARLLSGRMLPEQDFSSVVLRLPSQIIERGSCRVSAER